MTSYLLRAEVEALMEAENKGHYMQILKSVCTFLNDVEVMSFVLEYEFPYVMELDCEALAETFEGLGEP